MKVFGIKLLAAALPHEEENPDTDESVLKARCDTPQPGCFDWSNNSFDAKRIYIKCIKKQMVECKRSERWGMKCGLYFIVFTQLNLNSPHLSKNNQPINARLFSPSTTWWTMWLLTVMWFFPLWKGCWNEHCSHLMGRNYSVLVFLNNASPLCNSLLFSGGKKKNNLCYFLQNNHISSSPFVWAHAPFSPFTASMFAPGELCVSDCFLLDQHWAWSTRRHTKDGVHLLPPSRVRAHSSVLLPSSDVRVRGWERRMALRARSRGVHPWVQSPSCSDSSEPRRTGSGALK